MKNEKLSFRAPLSSILLLLILTTPVDAMAYIDPGTTGMLSQMLYVLFYGALGVFLYFLRSIKQFFTNTKQYLANLIGRRT